MSAEEGWDKAGAPVFFYLRVSGAAALVMAQG